ncbi:MAG: O-Antigen ligase [Verrucomicrobiales bacterium]|nr:O-Antigen ligase [Verrucomicrobiales bacterium]
MGKSLLIFIICVPLAILLGIMLSDPLTTNSMILLSASFALLLSPLLIKSHHTLLIIASNAYVNVFFLPGQPQLWVLTNAISFCMAIISRPLDRSEKRLKGSRSVTWSLLVLFVVIVVTAKESGGIGIRAFGSSVYGGKRYVWLVMGIAGYFALTSQAVADKSRRHVVGWYFLSGVTSAVGNLAYALGPAFYFLFLLFPVEWALQQAGADQTGADLVRLSGLGPAAGAVQTYMLAKYGIRGLLEIRHPWRLLIFIISIICAMFSGFRSTIVILFLILGFQFYYERLFRTRLFPVAVVSCLATFLVLSLTAERLPLSLQRTLTFLPIKVDAAMRRNADATIEWRVEMWKLLVKQIPEYFWLGKGFAMDPTDMYLAGEAAKRGHAEAFEGAIIAGDYHSGPLSVIIPLGIFGVIAFVWFLIAGYRVLRRNYLYGDAEMQRANTLFISLFMARLVFFVFFFGGFSSDLWTFTSLVGLSISMNKGICKPVVVVRPKEEVSQESSLTTSAA